MRPRFYQTQAAPEAHMADRAAPDAGGEARAWMGGAPARYCPPLVNP
ncbi:MAG TPA: hypothetical protein VLC54_03020 [Anaeromyxobacter sp.]|nr:hypothetical protein [Anaeromyxobacter sp.]